ncbi:MAG TPA: SDR family oxidoreductase [Solirubrobacterales bacterium]|nr:SDR family oxidoreductase [Solirubrobacterales bacterium]
MEGERKAGFDLGGHVALVTGGNSGIGLGIAAALAGAGADLAILGRRAERNEAAAAELRVHGGRVLAFECDVADPEAVEAAVAAAASELGGLDSCFAAAGVMSGGERFVDLPPAEIRRVLAVNLEGVIFTFQSAARQMVAAGRGGSLVGIASIAADFGQARGQHYAASKAGLLAVVRGCAVELSRHRIRANAILPGWTNTPMAADLLASEPFESRILPRVPARRWGEPADFAGAALYLASPLSDYHTGDTLTVDGGYSVF